MGFSGTAWKVRYWIIFSALFIIAFNVRAQSKIYVSGGSAAVIGAGANILLASQSTFRFSYPAVDAEYERRVIGAFSFVGGVTFFQAGYHIDDDSFSSASFFKANYIGAPVLARWNVGNKNLLLIDAGIVPYYLAQAHLRESREEFGRTVTVEGDIQPYSNRFYVAGRVEFLMMFNRFYAGWFILSPSKGQTTLKDLQDHWGLSAQYSTYLLSNGFSDYIVFGLKAGVRIR